MWVYAFVPTTSIPKNWRFMNEMELYISCQKHSPTSISLGYIHKVCTNAIHDTLNEVTSGANFYPVIALARFPDSSAPSSPMASGVVQKGRIKLPFAVSLA